MIKPYLLTIPNHDDTILQPCLYDCCAWTRRSSPGGRGCDLEGMSGPKNPGFVERACLVWTGDGIRGFQASFWWCRISQPSTVCVGLCSVILSQLKSLKKFSFWRFAFKGWRFSLQWIHLARWGFEDEFLKMGDYKRVCISIYQRGATFIIVVGVQSLENNS